MGRVGRIVGRIIVGRIVGRGIIGVLVGVFGGRGVGVNVGLRVRVGVGGPGVGVGAPGVDVGCGMSVLVGLGVFVDPSILVGRGSGVEVRSRLWQSGSALSIKWSPSSSLALKQYSLPPVSGINVIGGTSQRMIESKRISASELSMVSTYKPTSPVA